MLRLAPQYQELRAALHEFSHAAAAVCSGLGVEFVTTDPSHCPAGLDGMTAIVKGQDTVEAEIISLLAGPLAERRVPWIPLRMMGSGAESDFREVRRKLPQAGKSLRTLVRVAQSFVDEKWAVILNGAFHLCVERYLDADQVKSIIETGHCPSRPKPSALVQDQWLTAAVEEARATGVVALHRRFGKRLVQQAVRLTATQLLKGDLMHKHLPTLVAELVSAKRDQLEIKARFKETGRQYEEALSLVAANDASLQQLPKEFDGVTKVSHRFGEGERRALRDIYEKKTTELTNQSYEASERVQIAKNALVCSIKEEASKNLLDAEVALQLKRGFAAGALAGSRTTWRDYLASVIPEPKARELEALRTEIVTEFPVLSAEWNG